MMRISGRCCCVVLAWCMVAITGVQAQPGVQVITAEEMIEAGVTRLSDIFELAKGWTGASTDGYARDVSAAGRASLDVPAWEIIVDDVPMDLRVLGAQNINTVPLSVSEICRVELHTVPTLVAGRLAPFGAIHIRTCAPAPGISAHAVAGAGSETGDPGPFQYTEHATPNVDRSGPAVHGALAAAGAAWYVRVQGTTDEHHATDEKIRRRVHTLYEGEKDARILLRSIRAETGLRGRLGRHTVFGAGSRLQDLSFFEPLGLEVPVYHRFSYGGITGDFAPGYSDGVAYRVSVVRSRLDTQPNPGQVGVYWQQEGVRLHPWFRWARRKVHGRIGLNADYWRITAVGGVLTHTPLVLIGGYSEWGRTWSTDTEASVMVHATARRSYAALGILRLRRAVILTVFYGRQQSVDDHNLWYWIRQGYAPLGRHQARIMHSDSTGAARMFSGDVAWQVALGEGHRLTLATSFRHHAGYVVPSWTMVYDSLTTGLIVHTRTVAVRGHIARVALDLQTRPHSTLRLQIYGAYQRPISSSVIFRDTWHTLPVLQGHVTARFRPDSRFSLFGRLRYMTSARWPAYQDAARAAPEFYTADLPRAALLDFAVQKRFWGDHLRLSATLHNVLNQPYRAHPAGAVMRMAFTFRMQIFFQYRPGRYSSTNRKVTIPS